MSDDKLGPYELGPGGENEGIYTGDARILAEAIPDESVDLIFTDPPYPKEFLSCFGDLAVIASNVLVPNGLCVTYSGNQFLPEVMEKMGACLSFFWIGWVNILAQQQRIWHKKVWCGGKPILFYSKNGSSPASWFADTVASTRDKRFHKWGQSTSVAAYYIERLTGYNDCIVDPFCGGGTVPAVCKMLGRRYLAFEIDPETAELARERVRNTQSPLFVMDYEQPSFDTLTEKEILK